MKWVVAVVGAGLVTVGAFVAILVLPALLFPALYESVATGVSLFAVALSAAVTAGVLSFRATLRQYSAGADDRMPSAWPPDEPRFR